MPGIGSYDPRYEEEMRRRMAMYGQQPPMGVAGSVPPQTVAPMPSIPQMPPQPQPQMGMAAAQGPQGIGMSQQPVVPPTPMPQPQGVGIANNLDAGQPGMQQVMEDPTVGRMGVEDTVGIKGGEAGGFDSKALGKAMVTLAKGMGGKDEPMKPLPMLNMPKPQQQDIGMAASMPPQQPGMSNAMQAIASGIGSQPQLLEMLKRMRR
jgi:hypothetical protein